MHGFERYTTTNRRLSVAYHYIQDGKQRKVLKYTFLRAVFLKGVSGKTVRELSWGFY